MCRTVRDHRLESRTARLRLPSRQEPYWRGISEGAHMGYYRGTRVGKWVARFRPPGGPKGYFKTTLGETDDFCAADGHRHLDYRQAQEAARAWFAEMSRGRRISARYTVADALDDYLDQFTGKSLASTRHRIDKIIRPHFGHLSIHHLDSTLISEWHRTRATSAARLRTSAFASSPNLRALTDAESKRRRKATANRDLTVLKAALNRAYANGRVDSDGAWRRVRPFPCVDQPRLRYLSDDEARRLVNASPPTFRPMVQAALLTGARYGELAAVRAGDFDPNARTVILATTKAGTPRFVFLEEEAFQLFRQLVAGKEGSQLVFSRADGNPWKASQQARPLEQACRNAGLSPRATFHDLRRTYGARLARRGVPMAVIAKAMGHADERITMRHYAHLSPDYVSETIRANVAGMGIVGPSNIIPLSPA